MKCYLLTKGKEVVVKEVSDKSQFFFYNDGAYKLDSECVGLSYKVGRINPEPELYFTENNPHPINKKEKVELTMLEEVVLRNALENVSSIRGGGLFSFFGKVRDWITNPKNMTVLLLLFFVAILINGFLTGELHL